MKDLKKKEKEEKANSEKPQENPPVFFKGEHLAVRNAEGSFYLCQTCQNIYRHSKKIKIQWLGLTPENNPDKNIFSPEYYDTTEFETILTSLELKRKDKKKFLLDNAEQERIENILKKAVDKESGKLSQVDAGITEDNPDGLDISLYKDEDQLDEIEKKRKQDAKKKNKPVTPAAPKEKAGNSRSKPPTKKNKKTTTAAPTPPVKSTAVKKSPAPKKAAIKKAPVKTPKEAKKAPVKTPQEPTPKKSQSAKKGRKTVKEATPKVESSTKISERSSAPKRKAALIAEAANNSYEFDEDDFEEEIMPIPKKRAALKNVQDEKTEEVKPEAKKAKSEAKKAAPLKNVQEKEETEKEVVKPETAKPPAKKKGRKK